MITGELRSKVDRIWDTMWSGGISNPLSVIEQLTYLLFIKRLDELHTLKEHKANRTGKPIEEPAFAADQDHLRWSRFKETAPETIFETVRDEVFPFIKTLGDNGAGEGGSTYTQHMKDVLFMMPTPRVLASVVDQIDDIDMSDSDTNGDLYEYMLGKIATAGQNGQFRTPPAHHQADGRHDGPCAQGRDLRSGLRYGRLPHLRIRAPRQTPQHHHLQGRSCTPSL
jgi:type I restriction enzyme M protein